MFSFLVYHWMSLKRDRGLEGGLLKGPGMVIPEQLAWRKRTQSKDNVAEGVLWVKIGMRNTAAGSAGTTES
jgi:hypothetical protein